MFVKKYNVAKVIVLSACLLLSWLSSQGAAFENGNYFISCGNGHNDSVRSSLFKEVFDRDLAVVKDLIENGQADVNSQEEHGSTVLHIASGRGYPEIVRYLLSQGAFVNARNDDGETPLHLAALGAREEVVRILVEAGANLNIQDHRGRTPLACAIHPAVHTLRGAHERIVEYLQREMKALSSRMLLLGVRLNNVALVADALKKSANLYARDRNGNTPLHLAVQLNHPDMVKYLLQFFSPDAIRVIRNNEGLSVIDLAVTVPGMLDIFSKLM